MLQAKLRQQKGSAIIESAIGLWLIVTGVVLAVVLLVNCAVAASYKGKLGYIAQECARYAAGLPEDEDPTDKTERFADDLMKHMGLPTMHAAVTVEKCVLGDLPGARVTVGNSKLALFGNGTILPAFISMSDTAESARDPYRPTGVLYLYCKGQNDRAGLPNTQLVIPTYGRRVNPTTGPVQSPDFQRPPGVAIFRRRPTEQFWMSFPQGGYNASIPKSGAVWNYFDYPTTNRQSPPPPDGYWP